MAWVLDGKSLQDLHKSEKFKHFSYPNNSNPGTTKMDNKNARIWLSNFVQTWKEQHRCRCTILPRHGWHSSDNGPLGSYTPHIQGTKIVLFHYSRPRSHPVLHSKPPSAKFVLHSSRHPVFSKSDLSPTNQQSSRKNPQWISCLPHRRSFRGETHALQNWCILLLTRMDPWCKEIYPAMPYLPKQQVHAQQIAWVNTTSPNPESSLERFIHGFHNPLTFIGRTHHHLGHMWPFD